MCVNILLNKMILKNQQKRDFLEKIIMNDLKCNKPFLKFNDNIEYAALYH